MRTKVVSTLLAADQLLRQLGSKRSARDLAYLLGTGRLSVATEWKVMKALDASTIGRAVDLINEYVDFYGGLRKASVEELQKKGWLYPAAFKRGRVLAQAVHRYWSERDQYWS